MPEVSYEQADNLIRTKELNSALQDFIGNLHLEKWIMADPNFDSMFYDKKTGIPLNILELHDLFLKTYYPGGKPIERDKWLFEDRNRRANRFDPATLPIAMENGGHAFSGKINQDYVWWNMHLINSVCVALILSVTLEL